MIDRVESQGVECIVDFDAFHFPAHCVGKTIKEAGMRTGGSTAARFNVCGMF